MRCKIAKINDWDFMWEWVEGIDKRQILNTWLRENFYVYDCNESGDEVIYVAIGFEGEFTYYKVYHTWGWKGYDIGSEFEIEETTEDVVRTKSEVEKWYIV